MMQTAEWLSQARASSPSELIEQLLALLAEQPRSEDFSGHYLALVTALLQADAGALLVQGREPLVPESAVGSAADLAVLVAQQDEAADSALSRAGYTHRTVTRQDGMGALALGVRLLADCPTVLWLLFPERQRGHLKEALVRALLVKDIRTPASAGGSVGAARVPVVGESATSAAGETPGLLSLLALAAEVMQTEKFGAASLALVNGLVRVLDAQQVALCWRVESQARLRAVSHLERFERTSPLVQQLEDAALDVLATDGVVSLSRGAEVGGAAAPGHAALLSRLTEAESVMGLPVRDGSGQTQAVVLCLTRAPLPPEQINDLLLMLELIYPRLAQVFMTDSWWWVRWRHALGRQLEWFLGPRQPWAKAGIAAVAVVVAVLAFGRLPYRVEAAAQLATDYTRILGAQVDGRVDEVLVEVGDSVRAGQPMARIDTSDLRQQLVEIQSDIQRYSAEEDKARAAMALADAQVSRFRREQTEARLRRVQYMLAQSELKAPFDGVVVEGERKDLLGASMRRGDQMFRVAQVKDLYITAQVAERDVREVQDQAKGALVLLSQTGREIPFEVINFVPMAQVKGDKGNQFFLKARIDGEMADWWRPGMTGVARIDAGSRNIAWIVFHTMLDTLRLKFWW